VQEGEYNVGNAKYATKPPSWKYDIIFFSIASEADYET
jgi:hypothetical protein